MPSEINKNKTKEKVGVYICYCGGNISDHVDVEKVAENVKEIPGVAVARTNMFMCSDPGQELIMEDIKKGVVDRVVVASCAPSLHELTFREAIKRAGMNQYMYDQANIREQVSWVHHGDMATDKATTLVAAAIEKTKYLKPLNPIRVDAKNHATVIGGGPAGLRAARDLSKRGLQVHLLEKSPFLGGQAAQLDKLFPTRETAGDLIKQLTKEILSDSNITIITCAEIVKSEGYVGNFNITVQKRPPKSEDDLEKLHIFENSKAKPGDFVPFVGVCPISIPTSTVEFSQKTGVVVFATGFKTYLPYTGEYGYAEYPEVITLPQFISAMTGNKSHSKKLEINGKKIRRTALIHCVGSRHIPGIHEPDSNGNLNEYCSRVCCNATIQAANEIREKYPETQVFEFYRDIRTYGREHEAYYEQASKNNVLFFRFEPDEPPIVEKIEGSQYPLKIRVKDTLTFGEELEAEVDLVVLSVGMEPNDVSELVDMMKLPIGSDRFLQEVHPKLRPVEVANTGILLAGTCQAPMDIGEVCSASQAASAKAAILLSRGYVELDPFVAEVDIEKCNGSGKCTDACLVEGAIQQVETEVNKKMVRRAQINPALCTGCGICVAVCTNNAVDINGWALEQYEAMVDAIVRYN